jgi:hypothetical protein
MTQPLTPLDPLLLTIVLVTLAIGLPIIMVMAIRFLWDRNLNVGPSKQLEKLIWQLHRIASALEHQMNLSFPAVQPGTEEARDLAYLQRTAPQSNPATPSIAAPILAPNAVAASAQQVPTPQPAHATPFRQQASVSPPVAPQVAPVATPLPQDSSDEVPHRAGVNSMFGL